MEMCDIQYIPEDYFKACSNLTYLSLDANEDIGYSNNGENTEDKNYTEEVQSQWLAFFSVVVLLT